MRLGEEKLGDKHKCTQPLTWVDGAHMDTSAAELIPQHIGEADQRVLWTGASR